MTPLTIFLARVFGVFSVYLRRSSLVGVYLRRPSLVAPVLISSNLRVLRRISLSTSNRQHNWSSGVASEHNQRTALAAKQPPLSQSDQRIPHSIHQGNRIDYFSFNKELIRETPLSITPRLRAGLFGPAQQGRTGAHPTSLCRDWSPTRQPAATEAHRA